jgi:hypothetical protein
MQCKPVHMLTLNPDLPVADLNVLPCMPKAVCQLAENPLFMAILISSRWCLLTFFGFSVQKVILT